MRYIIIALILLFTPPVFAMNAIEQQVKELPETSERCIKKIAYYKHKIIKYKSMPQNERRPLHKIKLNYYINELVNWQKYCAGEVDSE